MNGSVNYRDEIRLVEHLTRVLEYQLAARGQRRHVSRQPVDVCQLGVLGPQRVLDEPRGRPSSLGVEFLVRDPRRLEVSGSFAFFTRRLPTLAEQRSVADGGTGSGALVEVIERHDVAFGPLTLAVADGDDDGAIQAEMDRLCSELALRPDAWREARHLPLVPEDAAATHETFTAWLDHKLGSLPPLEQRFGARLQIQVRPQAGDTRVAVFMRNQTPESDQPTQNNYRVIADVSLSVKVDGTLVPVEMLPVAEDYQYDRSVWAVGRNCSAVREGDVIRTRTLALARQTRIATRSDPPAAFATLADDPLGVLAAIHDAMLDHAARWREELSQKGFQDDFRHAAEADLERFRDETRAFAAGIAALETDERLRTAFVTMNSVFGTVSRFPNWRLFQIVFIVCQLPALVLREGITGGAWRGEYFSWEGSHERGEVLWFPTGGGKTEAYLGLVCTAILYDRLRGKQLGVTAWLRFPLRMLSIQQLQRAMRVLHAAERRRVEMGLGGDPFRLGYLAGGSNSPNQLREDDLAKWSTPDMLERLKLVPNCPDCGGDQTIEVRPLTPELRFEHRCRSCGYVLPLDVSDSEVLRRQSTVVIGTVDKMAALAFQPNLSMIWQVRQSCPEHGYFLERCLAERSCKVPKGRMRAVTPYDPGPSLHIQDELHLLQEELGAFAGHYETAVRSMEPRPAKVLAATATIVGYDHQMSHLYGVRSARRFPGRGLNRFNTFYSEVATEGTDPKVARVFVAFWGGLHPSESSALVHRILLEEVSRLSAEPEQLAAVVHRQLTADEASALVGLYSTSLAYVGSLTNGSRVRENLESGHSFRVEFTNNKSTPAEIADVVRRVESPPEYAAESFLDTLVATNMISHGVDLERINLMTLDRLPGTAAEYIQASSRAGRQHVGLVVVILANYNLRASSVYSRFAEYHDNLDRMVKPVAINRFAKFALRRTLPGILAATLHGRLRPYVGASLGERETVRQLLQTQGTRIAGELEAAYALKSGVYPGDLESGMRDVLADELGRLRVVIEGSQQKYLSNTIDPMTSLRDVEEGIRVDASPNVPYESLLWYRRRGRL